MYHTGHHLVTVTGCCPTHLLVNLTDSPSNATLCTSDSRTKETACVQGSLRNVDGPMQVQ